MPEVSRSLHSYDVAGTCRYQREAEGEGGGGTKKSSVIAVSSRVMVAEMAITVSINYAWGFLCTMVQEPKRNISKQFVFVGCWEVCC